MYEIKQFTGAYQNITYLMDFPKDFDPAKKYPVLFYLHGMGCVGEKIDTLKSGCPLQRKNIPSHMDFILAAPLCPTFTWFDSFQDLTCWMDKTIHLPYVDENRVYLSGSSMGGYTSWCMLVNHPTWFTAAVICCGAGMYWAADRLKMPIRAVHGDLDDAVMPYESKIMVEKINRNGGNATLITHADLGHNVWDRTFTNPETFEWLLSQQTKKEY